MISTYGERDSDDIVLSVPIERVTLDNGLRVNLSYDHSTSVVAINLWYAVGSRNELPGKTGFAHLFEHMMFQGSANVPKNRHFELVERAGGTLNATTWFDRTNYFETVPSHHLEMALWLESDRMGWMLPAMTQDKLDNQRDVVINEKKQRYDNQPYGDWDEWIQAMVYPENHPYSHTVIGSMEDIESATLEDVRDFCETFYVPNNAVLTVCGDFNRDEALDMIDKHFGEIPRGDKIPPIPGELKLDPIIGSTVREQIEADVPLPRVLMAFRIPPYADPDFYIANVAGTVAGSGRASRLYRSLVCEHKIAKDVISHTLPLMTGAGMFLVWATGFSGSDPSELEEALALELEGLESVTEDEIQRAVAITETSLISEIQRVEERADVISMFDQFFDDPSRLNSELERIRAVNPTQVSEFTNEFFRSNNRAVLTYIPSI
jgi:zinc protease